MSTPVWPSSVRDCFEAGETGTPDGRLRTATDAGPGKVRRRFSNAPFPFAATVPMPVAELVRLERFWDEDTEGGSLPFWIHDQIRHGLKLLTEEGDTILDEDGEPLLVSAWWLAMFNEPPQKSKMSRGWFSVSLSLNIMP